MKLIAGLAIVLSCVNICSGTIVVWPGNNHAYDYVNTNEVPIGWGPAKAAAESATPPLGFGSGHLVTISDQAENSFVARTFLQASAWIGFTDELVEGEWRWIDATPGIWQDPDNFVNPVQTAFTNWAAGEPNNQIDAGKPNGEDYGLMYYSPVGEWNDGSGPETIDGYLFGYVVEFEPIPEPSAGVILSIGAALCLLIPVRYHNTPRPGVTHTVT